MLFVYKSNRLENLAKAQAEVLREPLPSAAMTEWVGVQTQGVGIWLGMEIARRLGVWANVHSPYPRAMIEKIFSLVMGDVCPDTRLFEPERLAWSVLGLLPEMMDRPEFSPLKSYLTGDARGVKRFQLSHRIAETFDRYAVYRPDVVLAWGEGNFEAVPVASENRWQPILWQALEARHGKSHVAAAAKRCLETLWKKNECPDGLPPRISLFGVSTLPPLYVNLLAGLPECVAVHLFLLSPSREHWAYIRSRREIIQGLVKSGADGDRLDETLRLEEGNRLLASLGRLGRDFQGVLEGSAEYVEPGEDLYDEPDSDRLLHLLQSDILNLKLRRIGTPDPPLPVAPDDDSLRIHVCHSPVREVQVLHDQLLHVFQRHPGIYPHDVIVMMPDIDTYAPLIEAVFGSAASGVRIPYSISDQGPAGETPVIQAFMAAVRLARSRLPVQEMLDLLAMGPVRERFGLTAEDVNTVRRWITDAGVRWGIDAGHRADAGQPAYSENTWSFGLSRLFMGIAMPDDTGGLIHGTLPYPGIEGKESEILGSAAEFFDAIFGLALECERPKPAAEWVPGLQEALSRLIRKDTENEYQHRMILEILSDLLMFVEGAGFGEVLDAEVVTQYLTGQFKQRPSVRGFLSGGVTFCNLLPMRSIPFKVVCLLGMNDTDFPRSRPPSGFDLTAAKTRAGDRSVRNDDRYLFLEALLSARQKLMMFYVGRSVSDNSVNPPSVVVGELLDTLEEGFVPEGCDGDDCGKNLKASLVTEHPLQPFSPAYFDSENPERFSYSEAHLSGAKALTGPRRESPLLLSGNLPPREEELVRLTLSDLIRFFRMPSEYLLKQRLGIQFGEELEVLEDREPITLEPLARFSAGEDLLARKLRGTASEDVYTVLKNNGHFPIGIPGRITFNELDEAAGLLADSIRPVLEKGKMLLPVSEEAALDGVRITGTIDGLTSGGRVVYTFGRLHEGRKIDLWISHLFINVLSTQQFPASSLLIGMGKKRVEQCVFAPLANAADLLRDLLEIYRLGLTRPLPLFPTASCAYARAFLESGEKTPDPKTMASIMGEFLKTSRDYPGESQHPAVRRLFGNRNPLLEEGETGFAALAVRVFGPMFRAETAGGQKHAMRNISDMRDMPGREDDP